MTAGFDLHLGYALMVVLGLNTLTAVLTAGTWTAAYAGAQQVTPWQVAVGPISLLAALAAVDLCYCVEHRAAHRCNLLWVHTE